MGYQDLRVMPTQALLGIRDSLAFLASQVILVPKETLV